MINLGGREIARVGIIYVGAVGAGYILSFLRLPLPWMIGPMVLAAVVGVIGGKVHIPRISRPIGQTVVAASVGLSFTPITFSAISEQIVPMLAAALLTVLAGFLVAAVLMRITHIDVVSASLASIPVGPVEMAALAVRHGVDPGRVAFAQVLRIALIVLTLPPLIVTFDGSIDDPSRILAGREVDPVGAALLLAIATTGGMLFHWIRIPSPFFLGPLAMSATASGLALPLSALPFPVLAVAQVLLGVWLGIMFDKELLRLTHSFLLAALISTGLLLALCVAMAFGISAATGIAWQTMMLATAPGSVTEMALTAKSLQEGVALVSAFHVVRIFTILPSAPLIFAITARLGNRSRT